MTEQLDIIIRKDDLSVCEAAQSALAPLGDGQARIRVEKFALTSNNITYGVAGDTFGYWKFFPAAEGYGRIPVWGFGQVEASNHPDIKVGERVYGYFPMSNYLTVQPIQIKAESFSDGVAHRQGMAPVYNLYRRLDADLSHNPDTETERMLFEPLFHTAFLIEYMFRTADWNGAKTLIITSASSKTSLGLAQNAKRGSPEIKRVGLTSPRNVAFVERSGFYDEIRTYDEIEQLPLVPSVYVDMAGNADVVRRLHTHFGDTLKYACRVGATHWDASGAVEGVPGPEQKVFFAPTYIDEMVKNEGAKAYNQAAAAAWASFLNDAKGLLGVSLITGGEGAKAAYLKTLKGDAEPDEGLIVSL